MLPQDKTIIDMLHEGGYSCVIRNGNEVRTFTMRGVADLYFLLKNDKNFLKGAFIADKVVGKGAASLMVLGGISGLYTDIISSQALPLLRQAGIQVNFGKEVPHIINRAKDGWCPIETLCKNAATAQECFPLIEEFVQRMNISK